MRFGGAVETVQKAGQMLLEEFGQQLQISQEDERSERETTYDSLSFDMICQGLESYYPQDALIGERGKRVLDKRSKRIWVIDPICGSIPFSRGIADFIISVACISKSLNLLVGIVFDPVRDELFYAEVGEGSFLNNQPIKVSALKSATELKNRGMISVEHKMIRENKYNSSVIALSREVARLRVASTCGLELAYLACGRLDAALKAKQPLYDYAAGLIILQEAGGKATDFEGRPLRVELSYQKVTDILASNGEAEIHQLIVNHFLQP